MAAGAPWSIWRASVEDAANEKRTGAPPRVVHARPISSNAFVRLAAAKTTIGSPARGDWANADVQAKRTRAKVSAARRARAGRPRGEVVGANPGTASSIYIWTDTV